MHPVPPLAPHSVLVYLAAIAVLLAVARLLGRLATRIGMPELVRRIDHDTWDGDERVRHAA